MKIVNEIESVEHIIEIDKLPTKIIRYSLNTSVQHTNTHIYNNMLLGVGGCCLMRYTTFFCRLVPICHMQSTTGLWLPVRVFST